MKKKVSEAFGKKQYLLGVDENGIYYWLEEGKWDCDWYWGFGYIETFTRNKDPKNSKDIVSHQHFDGLFFNKGTNGYDTFNNFFTETTLDKSETWKLIELMKSFYTLRQYSDMLHIGGSHYTSNPISEIIKSDAEYERINKEVMPALMNEIYELLS